MEFSPYFKAIDGFCDKLVDAIERQFPCLTFSGYVVEDWAAEHEKALFTRHDTLRNELCAMQDAKQGNDLDQFRKKLLDWGKTVLKIYEKYHAWVKSQVTEVFIDWLCPKCGLLATYPTPRGTAYKGPCYQCSEAQTSIDLAAAGEDRTAVAVAPPPPAPVSRLQQARLI